MPSLPPSFRLYQSDGVTLVHRFMAVQSTNIPRTEQRTVIVEGIRGKGGIIINGGDALWDLELQGVIYGDDYTEVANLINTMENSILINIPYYLKFEYSATLEYSYKVKRTEPIEYPQSYRTSYQEYTIRFKANAW